MSACPVPLLDINLGLAELNHGSCFVLLPKVNFYTAFESCASMNGTLPVFLESEENWFLKFSLSGPRKSTLGLEKLWLGYSDNEEEGIWKDKFGDVLQIGEEVWGTWNGEKLPDNDFGINPSGEEEAQNYLTVNLMEQPAKIDDDFQFRKRHSFCQLHRKETKNVRQISISSFNYPEKIGDFENWDESEEFKAGMKVCAATFSFLKKEEDIEKMLIYQKATENAIVNGEKEEIKAIFKDEDGSKSEDGENFFNLFAFIAKKTTKDDSTNDFGVLSEVEIDDDEFLKNITEEYSDESLEFLESDDYSENGENGNATNPENNEKNSTNLEEIDEKSQNETIDQDGNTGLESGINSPMTAINLDTDINLEIHINSVSSSSRILFSVIILPLLVLGHS